MVDLILILQNNSFRTVLRETPNRTDAEAAFAAQAGPHASGTVHWYMLEADGLECENSCGLGFGALL